MKNSFRGTRPFQNLARQNVALAKLSNAGISPESLQLLRNLTLSFGVSSATEELLYLNAGWYATHTGLVRLASCRHGEKTNEHTTAQGVNELLPRKPPIRLVKGAVIVYEVRLPVLNDHRLFAALIAISFLRSGVSLILRAAPPFFPRATAFGSFFLFSLLIGTRNVSPFFDPSATKQLTCLSLSIMLIAKHEALEGADDERKYDVSEA